MKRLFALALAACLLAGCVYLGPREPVPVPDSTPKQTVFDETEPGRILLPAVARHRMSVIGRTISQMTDRQLICQLFIVTPEQLTGRSGVKGMTEADRAAFESCPVGGLILFSGNVKDPAQLKALIGTAQSLSELGLFIGVDEEGGSVSRVGKNKKMGTTAFPNMGRLKGDTARAYQVGQTIGSELLSLGFNLDFAPVADVDSNPNNPVIGTRAFSDDPAVAAQMVSACVSGFRDAGLLCVIKHFPGHGDTSADTHRGTAATYKTLDQLRSCEFLPFRAGIEAGADMVMVSHITAPNVTGDNIPATLSHCLITDILRGELGFEGVVITDAMRMAAVSRLYSSGEAAVLSLQAGADILLIPEDLPSAVAGVEQALSSGRLSRQSLEESVRRILSLKLRLGLIKIEKPAGTNAFRRTGIL